MKHPTPCRWCGSYHAAKCPLVKAIEYFEDGTTVKKVEFFAPNEGRSIGSPVIDTSGFTRQRRPAPAEPSADPTGLGLKRGETMRGRLAEIDAHLESLRQEPGP